LNEEPLNFEDSTYVHQSDVFGVHFYRIAAMDVDGNEAFGKQLIADAFDNEPPSIPTGLSVVPDTGRLIIQWEPNPEDDILGYKIYRSIKGVKRSLALLTADYFEENQFIDTLPRNARNDFSYAVMALDKSLNESKRSKLVSMKMIDATPPRAPFIKMIVNSEEGNADIIWIRNTELDLLGYNIFRKNESDSTSSFQQLNIKLIPSGYNQYTDRSAEFNQIYIYQLVALDSAENQSKNSNPYKNTIRKKAKDKQITVSFVKSKYNKKTKSVRLKWKTTDFPEDFKFIVLRKVGTGNFKPITKPSQQLSYTDTGLRDSQKVSYQIRLYYGKGKMVKSEVKSFTVSEKNRKNSRDTK
jgi:hypothetical protein